MILFLKLYFIALQIIELYLCEQKKSFYINHINEKIDKQVSKNTYIQNGML